MTPTDWLIGVIATAVFLYAVRVLLVGVAHDRRARKRDARELRRSAARGEGAK